MTRYLGEQGERCRLRAAVVLCAPLELRAMSRKYVQLIWDLEKMS